MTLGPLIALIPWAEKARGAVVDSSAYSVKSVLYYLAHILIIHISALIANTSMFGDAHQEWYTIAPFAQVPPESKWSWAYCISFSLSMSLFCTSFQSGYSKRKLKFL